MDSPYNYYHSARKSIQSELSSVFYDTAASEAGLEILDNQSVAALSEMYLEAEGITSPRIPRMSIISESMDTPHHHGSFGSFAHSDALSHDNDKDTTPSGLQLDDNQSVDAYSTRYSVSHHKSTYDMPLDMIGGRYARPGMHHQPHSNHNRVPYHEEEKQAKKPSRVRRKPPPPPPRPKKKTQMPSQMQSQVQSQMPISHISSPVEEKEAEHKSPMSFTTNASVENGTKEFKYTYEYPTEDVVENREEEIVMFEVHTSGNTITTRTIIKKSKPSKATTPSSSSQDAISRVNTTPFPIGGTPKATTNVRKKKTGTKDDSSRKLQKCRSTNDVNSYNKPLPPLRPLPDLPSFARERDRGIRKNNSKRDAHTSDTDSDSADPTTKRVFL